VTTTIQAGILGIGSYLPERRLTNADLEKIVETSDDWIVSRTGIHERRIAAEGENTSDLAAAAARKAAENAGIALSEIDLILVATVSPDTPMPSTACWVQAKLGLGNVPAFDLSAACAGFVYGLTVAKALVENGTFRHVLLIGAERLSSFVDWTDRATCVLFGDGAGAAIIGPTQGDRGRILSAQLGANGNDAKLLIIPGGGSSRIASVETVQQRLHFIKMQGQEVFKIAVKVMEGTLLEALRKADLTAEKLDWLIPHQANLRIIMALAHRMEFPMEKVFLNVGRVGNMSAASLIVALDEAVKAGQIKSGQNLAMVAFGAGTTVGSACIRW